MWSLALVAGVVVAMVVVEMMDVVIEMVIEVVVKEVVVVRSQFSVLCGKLSMFDLYAPV